MAESTPTFNIFGDPSKDDIRVGYISTDRGFVSNVTICEANDYAKLNPGTIFITRNRKQIKYIDINEVNKLTTNDLFQETGDDCSGIEVIAPCVPKAELDFFGGGGVGALGNPVVGKDGSILAVDLESGGYGYQYAPTARIKDPCGIGAGAELRVGMSTGVSTQLIEYDDEDDFEEYEICLKNEVGFGKRFDVRGRDTGEWNPNRYFDGGVLSFDEELKRYTEFLAKKTNPFWTTRTEAPLRVTTGAGDKISRTKYDVHHWAWGSVPNPEGTGTIIGDLYLELLGRKPDSGGFNFFQNVLDSGGSVADVRKAITDSEEFKNNELTGVKPVVAEETFAFGSVFKVDKSTFMNSYAISPFPMSNVVPSDFGGQQHYFEWEVDFPYEGDYDFKLQCDNQGVLYVDGQKKGEYKLGSGGAGGNVLSPPVTTKVGITTAGLHTIRLDIFNGKLMEKVAEQQTLDDLATSNKVNFKFSTNTMYANTLNIDGLDVSFEKKFGDATTQVREDFSRDVEYGRVYDVKITSNNIRTGNLPATNKELQFNGLHPVNNPINVTSRGKRLALRDGDGDDTNASFTIDNGNGTFAADGRSIVGTGEQTLTLSWNDRRTAGRAINSIKLGNTVWQRSGSGGSVTHTITLGGGIGQLGGVNNEAKLRARGNKIIQMEDIPGFDEEVTYDDLVLSADQGRFFDINGLTCKYTLGDRPAESGVSSTEKADEVTTIFNTTDFIDKANRPLWRTVPNVSKDSPFTNRYGITPFDPSLTYEGAQEGTHEIRWHNVRFPVSGEYDIGIGVDDNVRLRIGSDVDIFKQGFTFEGSETTFDSFGAAVSAVGQGKFSPTGTSLYRRFIKAGVYTVIADLEQIPGGKYGVAGGNTMGLAINIDTVFTERDVQAQRSWNQNPFGVALTIDAPDPPIPQEPLPVQEGRCPPNPFWSTRYPNADEQWFPFSDRRQIYRYAISPIKPYGEENTSGGGQTYSNTWKIDAPYDGFYKLKAAADDNAVIKLDGNEILRTEGLSEQTVKMVEIAEGEHQVTVEVTNIAQETFDAIDKRIFTTQGWSALGTEVEQTLNTNDVDFKFSTNTMYGNTLEIPGLDVSLEKKFGDASTQVRQDFSRKVVFGQVYDVIITSNNRRVGNLPAGNKELQFNGLHPVNNPINVTSNGKRLALRDGDGNDTNASFTIDNGNGTFAADGKSIVGTGEQTLTLSWSDRRQAGRAINSIKLGNTIWQRTGSGGSVTHTTNLGGGVGQLGGDNNLAHLRTKGENVIEMEDIPGLDEEVTYDDLVLSASQGRFFDINGLNAKFVLERKTKTVLQGGVGSGTVKDGVVYSGPELFHKNFSGWGAFMNRASLSQNPFVANSQVVNYTWSNVDFPEDGEYQVKFSNDAHASLYLDGKEIVRGNFDNEAGVSAQDESNWNGEGTFRKVLINKGKHTLAVKPTSLGLIDTLFKQPAGYKWHENPSGFAIEIRKKIQVVRTDGTGKPVAKSWKDNPVLVSAHLIPPPCPKKVEGIGTVDKVIPIDPGNGYPPPSDPDDNSNYNVALELTNVIVDDGGINYSPDDKVVITGRPGDPVIPPFSPKLDQFGTIIDIPVPPIDSGLNVVPIGFTGTPDITIETDSGIGFSGIPEFTVVRTPPVEFVDPDRLLQVTDLVGLKQTGYYNGKPYYGAIFYKDGIKYAGYYETAGQLVQIYDTLQESIDGEVTTAPSAIQRQGTDITSSDPTLNIPNTPDNLTY